MIENAFRIIPEGILLVERSQLSTDEKI